MFSQSIDGLQEIVKLQQDKISNIEDNLKKLIIEAIYNLDRPIVVAYLMIIVLIFVTLNLIVDITYSLLDPRVRIKGES